MNIIPQRGEIWVVSLDPTKGSEIKKTRPCLVLSRDDYNRVANTITIIPLTSGKVRYPTWEVEVSEASGLNALSHLVLPQIRIASKQRLKKRIGKISPTHFREIEEKLLFYLGFDNYFRGFGSGSVTIQGGTWTGGGALML